MDESNPLRTTWPDGDGERNWLRQRPACANSNNIRYIIAVFPVTIITNIRTIRIIIIIVTVLWCFILSVLFSIITFSNSSLVWSLSLALVARPVLWYEQYCSYPSFLTELVEMSVERERGSFHFQTGLVIYRENHVWIQFQRSQLSRCFFVMVSLFCRLLMPFQGCGLLENVFDAYCTPGQSVARP